MDPFIVEALLKKAHEVAECLKREEPALKVELAQVEKRKGELDAALARLSVVDDRVKRFLPEFRTKYQCPECFVKHEARRAVGSVSNVRTEPGEDVLVCNSCGCHVFFRDGTLG